MAEGEYRQKPLPGMIMGPSKEVKDDPEYQYFQKIYSQDTQPDILKAENQASKGKEKHPWRVAKGTKAYAGPWSEERSSNELGTFPEDVLVCEKSRQQDGPYTSLNVYIQDITPEQKKAFIAAGLDRPLWIIRQQLKGKKENSFMRRAESELE